MLRSHPRISIPTGESHFFIPIYRQRKQYGDLRQLENLRRVLRAMYRQSRDFLDTDLPGLRFEIESTSQLLHHKGCSTIPEVFSAIYEENARGEGKLRWGDKTPWYLLHMPTILEMFPAAQFIHIIRDGRDVALSLFRRSEDFGVYNMHSAAEYWSIYLVRGQALGSQIGHALYFEVRYEELLNKPEEVTKGICDFLGEKYSEKLIHYETATIGGKTPLLREPIKKTNAFKWKRKLSSHQMQIIDAVAGTILERNGYELTNSGRKISLLEKGIYRSHNAICNLIYRKKWLGIR